ncbi:hypothetical protein SAMN05216201_107216 [Pseudomonas linyingensis]|uniref:Uncharacterized protein n=1 Tax=Pseudomonas linyingensis TaxID=915471 RepID=A0A1H6Y609_9PSED|nr:hypothetical protein [Pseudomonas linyingensis]SEJ36709.1 hypothetical protein SAMN05216201_107216 [Pseudomonas linyingensis]
MSTRSPKLSHYALGTILACFLVNLLVRTVFKVGGPFATLLAAALVAAGLALVFRWRTGRRPYPVERRVLVALYALGLGLLYAGLLALMYLKEEPGLPGQLLFAAHYLAYPLLAWIALAPERNGE